MGDFFAVPVFFLVLATAGTVAQLVARVLGGKGTIEDTFTVLSLGTLLPTFLLMSVPGDIDAGVFAAASRAAARRFRVHAPWTDNVRKVAVPLWSLTVWVRAMPTTQRFGTLRTAFAVMAGPIPATVITLVFVR